MFPPTNVLVSGPAFSFLLYETCKSRFCQEGFLLGEIIHKETTSITDNDQRQVNVLKLIKISSVIPCPENYFRKGRVDGDKIKKFLGDQINDVVGWYKFHNFDSFKFTLKNQLVHNQLKELFKIPPDLFTFCLLITETTSMLSTYIHSQLFIRYHEGQIDKLPMQIPNLSEPNSTYKNCEPASKVFNEILSNLKEDIQNSRGVVAVSQIENAVQKHINGTVTKLATAEKKLFKLENEVSNLRMKLQKLETSSNSGDTPKNNRSVKLDLVENNNDNASMEVENDIDQGENNVDDNSRLSQEIARGQVTIRRRGSGRLDNGDVVASSKETLVVSQSSDDEINDENSDDIVTTQTELSSSPDLSKRVYSPDLSRRPKGGRQKKSDSIDSKLFDSDQEMKTDEKSTRGGRGRGRRGRK